MKDFVKVAAFAVLAAGSHAAWSADTLEGRWDAQLVRGEQVIPFRLDIAGSGASLKGTLYDGFRPYENTSSASFTDGKLVLNLEHYLTTISAKFENGKLVGDVVAQNRENRSEYGFVATRHKAPTASANAPAIAGAWVIPLETPSAKGENAFRFVVEQKGAEVAASILRIDGDTGAYSGTFENGKWVLSHFDGSRPGVIEVTPASDGTLQILQGGRARQANAESARLQRCRAGRSLCLQARGVSTGQWRRPKDFLSPRTS